MKEKISGGLTTLALRLKYVIAPIIVICAAVTSNTLNSAAAEVNNIAASVAGDKLTVSTKLELDINEVTLMMYNAESGSKTMPSDILHIDQVTLPKTDVKSDYFSWENSNRSASFRLKLDSNSDYTIKIGGNGVAVPIALGSGDMPCITSQPADKTAEINESVSLSVTATVPKGTLSYQWYESNSTSNEGGTAIKGAAGASFKAPSAAAGTRYYYCAVTNTDVADGISKTVTVASIAAMVTVGDSYLLRDLKDGNTWHISADSYEDLKLSFTGWSIQSMYKDLCNDSLEWKEGGKVITVTSGAAPFSAIAKLIDADTAAVRYIGIEKTMRVSEGTSFDEKTWIIPSSYLGDALMEMDGWEIENIWSELGDDEPKYGTDTIRVTGESDSFSAIVKMTAAGDKVMYIGIERQKNKVVSA